MKTPFPLFARLLLWFFINLLVLIFGLALMVRVQFGSLNNWLLPQTSQDQIQAMTVTLIGNLAHSSRADWSDELAQLSAAYKMDFAIYDYRAQWLAGSTTPLPEEVQHAIRYARENRPESGSGGQGPGMSPAEPSGLGSPPAGGPPGFNPRVMEPSPPVPTRLSPDTKLPDFPKSVIQTHSPPGYWLTVRIPPEPLQFAEPVTLVGMTPELGISPLLFNPKPWFVVAIGVILFSILFWFPLARSLTTSIVKMTRATESIAEGRFDIQLADSRTDELGRLSHAINRMAVRLKDFITGQKRFLGDAAHELCSPLVRMEIALGILEERTDEKSLSLVKDVREEVTHMRKLANDLLSFSKASLGESHLKLEAVGVAQVVEAARELEKGRDGAIVIKVPDDLQVWGNFELLHRAVANLLRNALRYAGDAGPITVAAWREDDAVFITISDEGPGVAAKDIGKLFDPFYRADSSRTSETGGVGLGLAIVKTCVEACRGVVSASNRTPHGLEVRLRLVRFEAS